MNNAGIVSKSCIILLVTLFLFYSAFSQLSVKEETQQKKFIESFNRAKYYFTINETRLAFPIFQELFRQQPHNSNINYLLGICYTEEDPFSGKSVVHLTKALKDVSMDYDAGSFEEKRTPIFVYYYLVIACSQMGKCKEAEQYFNYFHTLYGIEKKDYYIRDAQSWVNRCKTGDIGNDVSYRLRPGLDTANKLITKNIEYTTGSALYGVQVGALSRFTPVYEFAGLKNVQAFIDTLGMIRYVIGSFKFKMHAENLLAAVKEAGYKDAFIVDVNREKKFSEELVIVNNVSLYKNTLERIVFKVQIGVFRDSIPEAVSRIFLKLDGIEEMTENENTILTIGNFSTYEEAEKLKMKLISSGITDAFIVALDGEKKIDIKLARIYSGSKDLELKD